MMWSILVVVKNEHGIYGLLFSCFLYFIISQVGDGKQQR